jgi:hypothetical protein
VLYAFAGPNPPVTNIVIALIMLVLVTVVDVWCADALAQQKQWHMRAASTVTAAVCPEVRLDSHPKRSRRCDRPWSRIVAGA